MKISNFSFDDLKVSGRRAFSSIFSREAWRTLDALTVLKIVCLLLLFAPQWGLSWRVLGIFADPPRPFFWDMQLARSVVSVLRRSFLSGAFVAIICLVGYLGQFIIPFIRNDWLRIPLVAVLCLGYLFEWTMFDVSGEFSHQISLMILWGERSQIGTLDFYATEIVRNAAVVLALSIPLAMRPASLQLPKKWTFVTLSAVVLSSGMIWYDRFLQTNVPVPMNAVSNAAVILAAQKQMPVSPLTAGMRPKRDFDLPPPASPGIEHIIVIMDESVRGDYFTINDSALATTPYLASDPDVINFGVAVSGANCSVFSRMMLRFGMNENTPSNWRAAINQPTMWEYAKRAGYDTAFINSFDIPRQNWYSYSPAERRLIDKTENMLDVQLYMRDFHIADIVTRLVNEANGRKLFLYVDKFGVHVPYDNKFPPDRIRFAAAANSNIDKTIAEYKNAISWSVDHFFERLKGRIDLDKTLIIYTSDHGQSLYDGGYKQAHCTFSEKVVEGEGKVPLFAMSHVEPFARSLRKAAAADFSRFSHFDVFPTMLEAMGYDRTWIAGKYRSSMLFGSHAEPRGFYYGKPEDNNRRMSSDDKSARR